MNAVFQASYAIGLLLFGPFIDRFGTKIGYATSIAAWSLAAAGHALVGNIGGFFVARGALGLGEGGNFPVGDQGGRALVPQEGARLRDRDLQFGHQRGRHHRAGDRALAGLHLGLALGLRGAGIAGMLWLVFWIPFYNVPEKIQRLTRAELDHIRSDPPDLADAARQDPLEHAAALSADLVVHHRQVPDRPGLVVLPDLAARLLQEDARTWTSSTAGSSWPRSTASSPCSASWAAGFTGYLTRRGMAISRARKTRHAHLRLLRDADRVRDQGQRLGRGAS